MPTLSELSNQLFRDVDANHQDCVRQLEALERNRMIALAAIPGGVGGTASLRSEQRRMPRSPATRLWLKSTSSSSGRNARRPPIAPMRLRGIERSFREADAAALKAREQAEEKAQWQR